MLVVSRVIECSNVSKNVSLVKLGCDRGCVYVRDNPVPSGSTVLHYCQKVPGEEFRVLSGPTAVSSFGLSDDGDIVWIAPPQ